MKKLIILSIVTAIVLAAATATYLYLNPSYTLQGTVLSADDIQPVQNLIITKGSASARSGADGSFVLKLGRDKNGQIKIISNDYDTKTASIPRGKTTRTGLFSNKLTASFKLTPTVQEEANRKWNYIKYGQDDKVWSLINADLRKMIPENKYVTAVKGNVAEVTGAGGNLGNQTIASVTTLSSWKEPTTGKIYHNVKELQITDTVNAFGVNNNTNFVGHWVEGGGVWTFFANPKDPAYQAE